VPHTFAAHGHCRLIVKQAGYPGKPRESLPCFLGRHLPRQGGGTAIQRALVDRPAPSGWPFPKKYHCFGYAIDFFQGVSLPARNPHRRKEMQAIHSFLPVDRITIEHHQTHGGLFGSQQNSRWLEKYSDWPNHREMSRIIGGRESRRHPLAADNSDSH
jgi:hypothetical protein